MTHGESRSKLRTFLFLILSLGLASSFGLPVLAAEPATVFFSLDFPNSDPEHYSISAGTDGHAKYESSGRISSDSEDRQTYQTEFDLSEAARTQIFDLASQSHYFSGKVDSGKKLAFTGAKKLTYQSAAQTTSAAYNFSLIPSVQQLTTLFQNISATLEYGRRLAYEHRYQKLALDDELKRMESQARAGDLRELQAARPILQEIYDDASVMNVVRARAQRIMEMSKTASSTR